jgi:rSAM/selenodomain-associated transferase 1
MKLVENMSDRCLIIFAKYPEKGKVKSRLTCNDNIQFTADLYGHFLDDLLSALSPGRFRMKIAFDPPERHDDMKKRFGGEYEYIPQQGNDLGERMSDAFCRCFSEGFRSAILIGSDCPDLHINLVHGAFDALENGCEIAIGPSMDGGYYLIGFRKETFNMGIFKNISWGERSVYRDTVKRLHDEKCLVYIAPVWRDIDTVADLEALIEKHHASPFQYSTTMRFLKDSAIKKT